jgi:hypothetical protein
MDTTALPSATVPAQQSFVPAAPVAYQQQYVQPEVMQPIAQNYQQSAPQPQQLHREASIGTTSQKSIPLLQETTSGPMPSQRLPQRGRLTPQGSFSNKNNPQMVQPNTQYQPTSIDNMLNAAAIQMALQRDPSSSQESFNNKQNSQTQTSPIATQYPQMQSMQPFVPQQPMMQYVYQPQQVASAIPGYLQAQNGFDSARTSTFQEGPLSRTSSLQSVNSGYSVAAVQPVAVQPVTVQPMLQPLAMPHQTMPVFAGPPTPSGTAMSFQLPYYQSGAPMAPMYGGIAQQMAYPVYVHPPTSAPAPTPPLPQGSRIPSQSSIKTENSHQLEDHGEDSDEDFFENRRGWGGGSSLSLSSVTRK